MNASIFYRSPVERFPTRADPARDLQAALCLDSLVRRLAVEPNAIPLRRYIAFLRAINVGSRRVKMDHLRTLFQSLGFANVATFIASGNVIFESPTEDTRALERQIEHHLQQALGYEVATFIRSSAELAAIAHYQPFTASEPDAERCALSIAFLAAPPSDEARHKVMTFRTEIDDFHIHQREVYWLCRTKISESPFSGALLEKTIGMPATMRNVTTLRKLVATYAAVQ